MLPLAWILVGLLNLVAVGLYGFDKWRSGRQGARRVPERKLLWLVFLGGWPGAWLAMSLFRHKTRKQPFRTYAILWTVLTPFWLLVYWTYRELLAQ